MRVRRLLLLLILAAECLSPAIAAAAPHDTASARWSRYVLAPRSRLLRPERVIGASSGVRNASAALAPGGGGMRMVSRSGSRPYVDFDFGKVVLGHLSIRYDGASTPAPRVDLAFSETRRYLGFRSDFSRSDNFSGRGRGADQLVPRAAGGTWTDRLGCSGHNVCSDGLRAFRYVRLFLSAAPGDDTFRTRTHSVTIEAVSLHFTPYRGAPATFRGWFLSSDDLLNRAWYASVYTNDLNTYRLTRADANPRGGWSATLAGKLLLNADSKRDRTPYVGDLAVQALTEQFSHADWHLTAVILADLAARQRSDGYIPPSPFLDYELRLADYPLWWVIDLGEYSLYSGDLRLAEKLWPALVRVLDTWYTRRTDTHGLLQATAEGMVYRDYTLSRRRGEPAYLNALYVNALRFASRVGTWTGHADAAARWDARAARVARAIDARLWDSAAGAYIDTSRTRRCHPLDANAFAVLGNVTSDRRTTDVLDFATSTLTRPWGLAFADVPDCEFAGSRSRVYPFVDYFAIAALFDHGRDRLALSEIRRTWGWMLHHDPRSTTWEAIGSAGTVRDYYGGVSSMSHGWSTGATPALTENVLGVKPAAPGYRRFVVLPHPADVRWARGRVPTPHGAIDVAWKRTSTGLHLRVRVPVGTTARLGVPKSSATTRLFLDGHRTRARVRDGYFIAIDVGPGVHVLHA